MAWPLKHRLLSFVVTMGVTLGEFVVLGGPIAAVAWLVGMAGFHRILVVSGLLAALWSLGISLYGHIWPPASPAPRRISDQGGA